MRRVGEAEAHELISWLDQPPWTSEIGTGYDREGWADSIWVLHAMFERDRVPDVTYEEIRRRAIDEGAKDPMAAWNENTSEEVIAAMRKASGGVIVLTADGLVDTGIPLGSRHRNHRGDDCAGQRWPPVRASRWEPRPPCRRATAGSLSRAFLCTSCRRRKDRSTS